MSREIVDQPVHHPIEAVHSLDLDSLLTLEQQAFPLDQWDKDSFQMILDEYPQETLMAVKVADQVIAYIFTLMDDEQESVGELGSIAVLREFQGKGLGRKLLTFGIDRLTDLGARSIILQTRVTNVAMQKLALEFGFVITRVLPGFYESDQGDAYEMILNIPAEDEE